MIAIITLIIFTLILFSFVLGLLVGKLLLQPQLIEANELTDSYADFQKDFLDFSERN
ncbi:hypothetical protein [Nostoc sp. NMS4]|uniref:hypothetical protein n=1 Tax=Nostoc sp. NMS4 TaxID=2815390 RepID=UPI0025F0A616|nr:hypothetical protein [Nostoc sp. NMS4]MBN3927120.1 hypothetical protein [Nostoc sp. NMS4]